MSEDSFKNITGRHREQNPLPIDNPEVRSKSDWWDDLCKAHGEKNHWNKDKSVEGDKEEKR